MYVIKILRFDDINEKGKCLYRKNIDDLNVQLVVDFLDDQSEKEKMSERNKSDDPDNYEFSDRELSDEDKSHI